MIQDPNVERMISEAISPLTKEIKELKRQIEALKQVNEFAIPAVSGRSEQLCPMCQSSDLIDIDDNYTKCRDCGFSFVGA